MFDDKWNYDTVKELLSNYPDVQICEKDNYHFEDRIDVYAFFPWDYREVPVYIDYDRSFTTYESISGMLYLFTFDVNNKELVDMNMAPSGDRKSGSYEYFDVETFR